MGWPCGVSVHRDVMISMERCCGGGGVTQHRLPNPMGSEEDNMDENPARPRTVLAATALVGVVFLLGGVAMVCRHLLLIWAVVSGRKPRFGDGGALVSFLRWEHRMWRHGWSFGVVVLRCLSLVWVNPHGRNAQRCR
jgi:hypothetical protein